MRKKLDAGGKPSTWLPPGRLVEPSEKINVCEVHHSNKRTSASDQVDMRSRKIALHKHHQDPTQSENRNVNAMARNETE